MPEGGGVLLRRLQQRVGRGACVFAVGGLIAATAVGAGEGGVGGGGGGAPSRPSQEGKRLQYMLFRGWDPFLPVAGTVDDHITQTIELPDAAARQQLHHFLDARVCQLEVIWQYATQCAPQKGLALRTGEWQQLLFDGEPISHGFL